MPKTVAKPPLPDTAISVRGLKTRKRERAAVVASFEWTSERVAAVRVLKKLGVTKHQIAKVLRCSTRAIEIRFPLDGFSKYVARTATGGMPDRDIRIAETLAAYGVPKNAIEQTLGVSRGILERCAGARMEIAVSLTNAKVAGFLFDQARGGSVPASIYWLKTRGGAAWRETQHVQIEGKVGVLVAPGGVEPEKWIETEAVRTMDAGGTNGGAAAAGTEAVRRAVVDAVVEQGDAGAVAPWDVATTDESVVVLPFEPDALERVGLPQSLSEAAEESEATEAAARAAEDAKAVRMLGRMLL